MNICIYGASSETIDKKYIEAGMLLGKEISRRGHTLVFGGGSTGMMGAVCRGFAESGKKAIGIAPRFFDYGHVLYHEYCSIIFTQTMRERKKMLMEYGDAFIALPGGIGTLDELFEALTARHLGQIKKTVILYNIDGFWDDTIALLQKMVRSEFISSPLEVLFSVCSSVDEIFGYLEGNKDA